MAPQNVPTGMNSDRKKNARHHAGRRLDMMGLLLIRRMRPKNRFPSQCRAWNGRDKRLLAFADIDAFVRRLAYSLPFVFMPDGDVAGHKGDRHMFLILFRKSAGRR
ncbi:UNVERIFIED_ORG: hypothetical protein M2312_004067 [Rhizobium esperanzae]|nr:hypothetical protein [Rhizobium esperanzae]